MHPVCLALAPCTVTNDLCFGFYWNSISEVIFTERLVIGEIADVSLVIFSFCFPFSSKEKPVLIFISPVAAKKRFHQQKKLFPFTVNLMLLNLSLWSLYPLVLLARSICCMKHLTDLEGSFLHGGSGESRLVQYITSLR